MKETGNIEARKRREEDENKEGQNVFVVYVLGNFAALIS